MTVLQWIQRNAGKSYSIFKWNERCRSYIPYQQDYRKVYNLEIDNVKTVESHKFVFDRKLLTMVKDKPSYHLYIGK